MSNNVDVSNDRLSLSNLFTVETDKEGWLQVNIANLDLTTVDTLSINLGKVKELHDTLEVDTLKHKA